MGHRGWTALALSALLLVGCGEGEPIGAPGPGGSDPQGGAADGTTPGAPVPVARLPQTLQAPLDGALVAGSLHIEVAGGAPDAGAPVPLQLLRSQDGRVLAEMAVLPGFPVDLDLTQHPDVPSGTWVTVVAADERAEVLVVHPVHAGQPGRFGPMRYSDLQHAVAMTLVLPTHGGIARAALRDDETGELVAETELRIGREGQLADGLNAFRGWLVMAPEPNHAFAHVPPRGTPMSVGMMSDDGSFQPLSSFRWGEP